MNVNYCVFSLSIIPLMPDHDQKFNLKLPVLDRSIKTVILSKLQANALDST